MSTTQALEKPAPAAPAVVVQIKAFELEIQKKAGEYLVRRGAAMQTLKDGVDFGPPWPGSKEDTLLLPGAEKFNAMMGVYPRPTLREKEFNLEKGFFYFSYEVALVNKETGMVEAVAEASCNSWEDKYRYRVARRKCPACGQETIMKSKEEWGGGWYCNAKKGGCGGKWGKGHKDIEGQTLGQIEHPNPANEIYTLQAMAQKRARIAATRSHGCLSGMFAMPDDPEKGPVGYEPPPYAGEEIVEEPVAPDPLPPEPVAARVAEADKPVVQGTGIGPKDKLVAEFKSDVLKIVNEVLKGKKTPDQICVECFGKPMRFANVHKEELLDLAKAMAVAKDYLK